MKLDLSGFSVAQIPRISLKAVPSSSGGHGPQFCISRSCDLRWISLNAFLLSGVSGTTFIDLRLFPVAPTLRLFSGRLPPGGEIS